MSSILSTGDAPAQRVPAWKRLGLKLKPASEDQGQNATLPTSTVAPPLPNHHRENLTSPINLNPKRKSSGVPALDHSAKRAKTDVSQNQISSTQTPKKAKSVSFATESNQKVGSPAAANGTQIKNKQKQQPTTTKKAVSTASAKPVKKQAPVNLEPALAYLRQWHTSKNTWKFNKNHQTKLLEQVFADETTIPAADIHIFYEYIRGLKGAVRSRLKELASGIKTQDMEQGPTEGFPASNEEMAERKQKEYYDIIATFLSQSRSPGKRRFEEVDYVLRTSDIEMQRRVVKRMRCENVLDELSDGETETASTTTSTTTSTEKGGSFAAGSERATSEDAVDKADGEQRLSLNDGSQQRVKRRRKLRTAAVEEETSSDSDSESDSDSGSDSDANPSGNDSSSSSEDSEDETAQPQENGVDSSSSSSSSSSEADSDSDDEDDD